MADQPRLSIVPSQGFDRTPTPASEVGKSRELDWIAHESAVARAQLEAQLQHERNIQGATSVMAYTTQDYHASTLTSMAERAREIEDPTLGRVHDTFVRDFLVPRFNRAMAENFDEAVTVFKGTRRPFDPPPAPKPKRHWWQGDDEK